MPAPIQEQGGLEERRGDFGGEPGEEVEALMVWSDHRNGASDCSPRA